MKINRDKVIELINTSYNGNFSRFSKEVGVDPSHIHRCLHYGVGGGKKVVGAILKLCVEKGLKYEDFIEL